MAKNKHLLVISPQMALIADLNASREAGFYALTSLRQINGTFIEKDKIVVPNLAKLFNKLDKEISYDLILPDNLFFDQIEEIASVEDDEIKKVLADEILPALKIDLDLFQVRTASLSQLGQKSRIQISAVENNLIGKITAIQKEMSEPIIINSIIPMSWLIKAVVTLEPSLSVLQIGEQILLAYHYIGLVKTKTYNVDDIEEIIKTIKSWKKTDAGLQTIYLATDQKIEKALTKALKDVVLPIQQLSGAETADGVAPAIKVYLEAAARSLDIPEFAIPYYELDETLISFADDKQILETANTAKDNKTTVSEEEIESTLDSENEKEEITEEVDSITDTENDVNNKITDLDTIAHSENDLDNEITELETAGEVKAMNKGDDVTLEEAIKLNNQEQKLPSVANLTTIDELSEEETVNVKPVSMTEVMTEADGDLINQNEQNKKNTEPIKQDFANTDTYHHEIKTNEIVTESPSMEIMNHNAETKMSHNDMQLHRENAFLATPPPKKEASAGKKVLVFLGVFLATVAVGLALGFGAIYLLNNQSNQNTEAPVASPTPVVETTPEPVASAAAEVVEINRDEIKVLVLNATKTAGLAGKLQTKVKSAGYGTVDAGNSKMSNNYTKTGYYVLLPEDNTGLVADLEEATGLDLLIGETYSDEDGGKNYDAIIVINESGETTTEDTDEAEESEETKTE